MFLQRALLPLLISCGLTGCIFQTETEPSSGWDLEANNTSSATNNTTQGGNNTTSGENNATRNNTQTGVNNATTPPNNVNGLPCSTVEDGMCPQHCDDSDPDCAQLDPCQDGPLTCMNPPPDCPLDTIPEIVDGCYGDCVDADTCEETVSR